MELDEYDEIIRSLVRIAAHQEDFNRNQGAINQRLTAAIERIDFAIGRLETTLAAIKDLLERGQNGR